MSPTPIALSPAGQRTTGPRAHGRACPLASNCSCVFQRVPPAETAARAPEPPSGTALASAVTTWTEWGWSVVRTSDTEVVLERRRALPFCLHLALTVLTGFLWLLYWVPRVRRPRFDTVTLTLGPDGAVSSSSPLR